MMIDTIVYNEQECCEIDYWVAFKLNQSDTIMYQKTNMMVYKKIV